MKSCCKLLSALSLACAMPALAQQQDSSESDITVQGSVVREPAEVREAVQRITTENGPDEPLLRMFSPLCLSVSGMPRSANLFVRDRVEANASEAGVELAEDCGDGRVNALVLVVRDPARVVDMIIAEQPDLIGVPDRNRVAALLAEGASVLHWVNEEVLGEGGRRVALSDSIVGASGSAASLNVSVPVNTHGRARRVGATHARGIRSTVLIIDADWLVGMDLERVADFASMRLLAPGLRPERHAESYPPSVIAPFAAGAGEEELTRFDRAYLAALYDLRPNAPATRLAAAVAQSYDGEQ